MPKSVNSRRCHQGPTSNFIGFSNMFMISLPASWCGTHGTVTQSDLFIKSQSLLKHCFKHIAHRTLLWEESSSWLSLDMKPFQITSIKKLRECSQQGEFSSWKLVLLSFPMALPTCQWLERHLFPHNCLLAEVPLPSLCSGFLLIPDASVNTTFFWGREGKSTTSSSISLIFDLASLRFHWRKQVTWPSRDRAGSVVCRNRSLQVTGWCVGDARCSRREGNEDLETVI